MRGSTEISATAQFSQGLRVLPSEGCRPIEGFRAPGSTRKLHDEPAFSQDCNDVSLLACSAQDARRQTMADKEMLGRGPACSASAWRGLSSWRNTLLRPTSWTKRLASGWLPPRPPRTSGSRGFAPQDPTSLMRLMLPCINRTCRNHPVAAANMELAATALRMYYARDLACYSLPETSRHQPPARRTRGTLGSTQAATRRQPAAPEGHWGAPRIFSISQTSRISKSRISDLCLASTRRKSKKK